MIGPPKYPYQICHLLSKMKLKLLDKIMEIDLLNWNPGEVFPKGVYYFSIIGSFWPFGHGDDLVWITILQLLPLYIIRICLNIYSMDTRRVI